MLNYASINNSQKVEQKKHAKSNQEECKILHSFEKKKTMLSLQLRINGYRITTILSRNVFRCRRNQEYQNVNENGKLPRSLI